MPNHLQKLLAGIANPFILDRVDSPWQEGVHDVPEINRTAFQSCLKSIEEVHLGNQSRGLVLHGEPGAGKTHLLQRLRLYTQKEPRTWFVSIPPQSWLCMGTRLLLGNQQRLLAARIDGDVLARYLAENAGHHRSPDRLARDGGNAEKLALRLRQQVGQAHGIVNIRADIRVQQDLGCHGNSHCIGCVSR